MKRLSVVALLAFLVAEGWCLSIGCSESGKRCDVDVASVMDWQTLNIQLLACDTRCEGHDTVQVTVTADLEFKDSVPDSTCLPTFNAIKFEDAFVFTSDSQRTISNLCMENTAGLPSYGMFNVVPHLFVVKNLKFKNVRVDANGARYFGFLAGRVDGDLRIENVSFENVSVKADSASTFAGGLVGIVSPPDEGEETGKAVLSRVRVRDFVVNSSSKKAVGGLVGYVQDSLSVMLSDISLSMVQHRIDGEVDANTTLFGGIAGMANNMLQLLMDTVRVDINVNADFDSKTEVVNIGGIAGKVASGGFLASNVFVGGRIKTSAETAFSTDHFFATVFYMGGLVGQWKAIDSDTFWVNGSDVAMAIDADSLLVPFLDVGGVLGNAHVDDEKARPLVSFTNASFDGSIHLGFSSYLQRAYAGGLVGDLHSESGKFSVVIEDSKSRPDIRGYAFSGAAGGLVGRMDAQAVSIRNSQSSGKIGMQMHNLLYDYRSPLYVGGLVGFSENAKLSVRSSSHSGNIQLAVQRASLDTSTSWVAGGLVGLASKGFLSLDSSFFAGRLLLTNVPGQLSAGGLLGRAEKADSLAVLHSYATGTLDTLMETIFQPSDTGSFAVGGLVGLGNEVPQMQIRNCFARGAMVLRDTLLSTGQEYMNVSGILGRDATYAKSASLLVQDVYYRGAFVMDSLRSSRLPRTYGVVSTSNREADVNAVYAVDFAGVAQEASDVKWKGIEIAVNDPSEEFILQERGDKYLFAVNTSEFRDLLNDAVERDPVWDWDKDVNDGLPWLVALTKFDAYDGEDAQEDDGPDVVVDSNYRADSLEQARRCEYIEVYASGNVAKVDVHIHNRTPSPVVMTLSLVDGAGKSFTDTMLVKTSEDSLDTFIFKDIPAGTYRAVVKLDTNVFETTEWNVAAGVTLAADTWTMVALGSVEKEAVKNSSGLTIFRWDERAKVCDYWQYVAYALDDDMELADGFWAYSKSELMLPMKAADSVPDSLRWQLYNEFYGWSLVANPYPWAISSGAGSEFMDAESAENPVWAWNSETRTYTPVDVLPPYGAFWVHSDSESVRAVSTEPVFDSVPVAIYGHVEQEAFATLEKSLRKATPESWSVRLLLKGEAGSEDAWNVVGVGSRDVDVAEPPAGMSQGVNLSISGRTGAPKGLAKSIRALSGMPADGSVSWTLAVSSAKPQTATLDVEGLDALEALGYGAVLVVGGVEKVCRSGEPVKLEVASGASSVEFRVAPKSALPSLAAPSIGSVRFARLGSALDVRFDATPALAGSGVEVRLLDLHGRTVSMETGKVRSGSNSVTLASPGRSGVYVLFVHAGNERKSMRIRL